MSGRWPCILSVILSSLALAAEGANLPPEVVATPATVTLRAGNAAQDVSLAGAFRDPDVTGTVVRLGIRIGAVTRTADFALHDTQTPLTVANFRKYVRDGRYLGSFIHRSVPGFVEQSGGYYWSNEKILEVPSYGGVTNEPGISNLRGTVAMAKLGGDPDSATSQWFVNLADNSANLDAQNGGFTVFARVLGNGMAVFDEIAALPQYNAGSPLDQLPLKDVYGSSLLRQFTVETTSATEVPALTYSATSGNPALIAVSVTGNVLRLTQVAAASGPADVTIRATDLEGAAAETTFRVDVRPSSFGWSVGAQTEWSAQFQYDPSAATQFDSNTTSAGAWYAPLGQSADRTLVVQNNSATPLTGVTVALDGANAGDFTVSPPASSTIAANGGSTSLTVHFTPTSAATRQARLRVSAADSAPTAFYVDISARGVGSPVITGLGGQSIGAGSDGMATTPDFIGHPVQAVDPEGVSEMTQSPAPGTPLPLGLYDISFTAKNTLGYSSTASLSMMVHYARPLAPEAVGTGLYPGASLPDGSVLTSFGEPAISDRREIAARVTLRTGTKTLGGIYRESASGSGELLAVQNGTSGISATTFCTFRDPQLSSQGAIAFGATVNGLPVSQDGGVWSTLFGPLQPVLQEGQPVPGLGGARLKSVTSMALDDAALTMLVALAPQPGVVAAGVNDVALVRLTGVSAGTLLARTNAVFENTRIKRISVLQPAPRSPGQGRWEGEGAMLANFSLQDGRTVVVKILANGQQTRRLQTGVADVNFGAPLGTIGLPAAAGAGVAVLANKKLPQFGVQATTDSALLYTSGSGAFVAAVSENASAQVNGGGRFASFSDPVANSAGDLLFYSTLRGGVSVAANAPGIWQRSAGGSLRALARVGAAPPDQTGALIGGAKWAAFTSFALPDGAGARPLVLGQMTGAGMPANQRAGLWAADAVGNLKLVFRGGWQVALGDTTRQVASFRLLSALPGSFGAARSYNSSGSVALLVTFPDHTTAVVRVDLP